MSTKKGRGCFPMNDKSILFNEALTISILEMLERNDITKGKFATFARSVLGKKDGGKTFRLLRNGRQKWSVENIYNIARYFGEEPSIIMARAEIVYKTRPHEISQNLEKKKYPKMIESPSKSTK